MSTMYQLEQVSRTSCNCKLRLHILFEKKNTHHDRCTPSISDTYILQMDKVGCDAIGRTHIFTAWASIIQANSTPNYTQPRKIFIIITCKGKQNAARPLMSWESEHGQRPNNLNPNGPDAGCAPHQLRHHLTCTSWLGLNKIQKMESTLTAHIL